MEPATIESLITKAAQLTLFVLMLCMGLNLTLRQITALGQNRGLLLRALLASFMLVPIAAVIILSVIPLTASTRIGIFLMALTPGAPLIYRRVSQLGWDAALAVSYQVMVSLLAIAFLPVAAVIVSHLFLNQAIVTPLEIFKQVIATQFIPLIMGLSIKLGIPDLANSLENFVTQIGNFMFLALAVLILIKGLEFDFTVIVLVCGF